MPKLFLDANIFFAATCSESGGSRALFKLAEKGLIKIFTSKYAFEEALVNVEKKLGRDKVPNLLNLVSLLDGMGDDFSAGTLRRKYQELIVEKDVPILIAAETLGVDALITLDKKDFKTKKLQRAKLPFIIASPGEFLKEYLGRPL